MPRIPEPEPEPELALIVGSARSGTTLLRLLLDAHPEIGCPAEAGLPGLISHMAGVWATIDADIRDDALTTDPGQPAADTPERRTGTSDPPAEEQTDLLGTERLKLPEPACAWIHAASLTAMRRYCDRGRNRVYVDKSLDSVFHLELVHQVFPGVRCVLVCRHVMDTIASGIEASPWGFQAYGYAPYVQRSPGNTVMALASYWLDHVTQALAWEKQHPEICTRVKYEDLVAKPEGTVSGLQRFLGVKEDLGVLRRAFDRDPARGPGDYKVEHTTGVHTNSIGHGKRVPVSMLPPSLLSEINEKLAALGYPTLDRSWNTAERAIDAPADTIWTTRLQDLMSQVRLTAGHWRAGVFALVAEDHRASRWIIDTGTGSVTQGDGDVEAVLTGTTEDLVLMLANQENLGTLLRSGRIRHLTADDAEAARSDNYELVKTIVTTLQSCIGDGARHG